MYVIWATVPLNEDRREEAVEAASELARDSRQEEGIVEYRVGVDVDDETVLRFFELYEDKAAIAAHDEADHYLAFKERLPEFLDGEVEAVRYQVADATELR